MHVEYDIKVTGSPQTLILTFFGLLFLEEVRSAGRICSKPTL